jgi:hypothetical protein
MSATNAILQTSNGKRATAVPERPVVRRVRLALLWVVVVLACFIAYRLGRQYAEWREVANQRPTRQSRTPDENAMAVAMMPLAGSWSFDDLDWNIHATKLSNADVASRFAAFSSSNGGASVDTLPDVSDKFLTLVGNLNITPVEHAGNQIYKLNRPEIRGQLVTRNFGGRAKIVSLAVATPHKGEQWLLHELTPRQAAAKTPIPVDHLLPVPAGARREGGKYGIDGELLLELVSLNSNADELVRAWRAAGWNIHETGLGDGDAFSYLCARGSDTIYVWSADERNSLQNLMLVRSPGSGDTEAKP